MRTPPGSRGGITFDGNGDSVVFSNQVPAGQQLRGLRAVGAPDLPDAVAQDAVRVQPQLADGIHVDDVLLPWKGTREVRQHWDLLSAGAVLNAPSEIQPGTTRAPQESSSPPHFAPADLKQASDNPIQNIPLGLPTDSNAADEEGARPGILKVQQ